MSGILYLVGTPIGNLGDISPRALETLEKVDFIACEDTRVSIKLLNHFSIKKPLLSYHGHNERRSGEDILQKLLSGKDVALISDAGMPCVSDPGEFLVRKCREAEIKLEVIPGPTAFVAALVVSGLTTGRFTFEGFLPVATKERRQRLEQLATEERSMIFYEAPHKLKKTLADFLTHLGDRDISISRELTKRFEETLSMTLQEAVSYYTEHEPRGEFVLVLAGATHREETMDMEVALSQVQNLMENGMTRKTASKEVSEKTGISKNLLYSESLKEN